MVARCQLPVWSKLRPLEPDVERIVAEGDGPLGQLGRRSIRCAVSGRQDSAGNDAKAGREDSDRWMTGGGEESSDRPVDPCQRLTAHAATSSGWTESWLRIRDALQRGPLGPNVVQAAPLNLLVFLALASGRIYQSALTTLGRDGARLPGWGAISKTES